MRTTSLPTRSMWPVGIAVLCLSLVSPPGHASTWDAAQEAFSNYEDAKGLKLLEQAAEEGDTRAIQAWTLALIHRQRLFPRVLKVDDSQVSAWLEKVSKHCARPDKTATDIARLCQSFELIAAR